MAIWQRCTPETWVNDFDVVHRRIDQRKGALNGDNPSVYIPYDHYTEEPEPEERDAPQTGQVPFSAPYLPSVAPQDVEPVPWDSEGRLRGNRQYIPPPGITQPLRRALAAVAVRTSDHNERLLAKTAKHTLIKSPSAAPRIH